MNFFIQVNCTNEQTYFIVNPPFELFEKNQSMYISFLENYIYKCKNNDINYEELFARIKKTLTIIKNELNINPKTNIIFKINNKNEKNNINKVIEFIKNNKNLKIELFMTDYNTFVKNLNKNDYPNLLIRFQNSDEAIPYKDFYSMYQKLNEIVKFINHYDLSNLEKVLLVYDIVKANEYKKESNNEDYRISRNLNQIINNDKIVCVGYSNLLSFLLSNINIKNFDMKVKFKNKNNGHQRNFIHLKDDKYNIDGMFFLDSTWDSKKSSYYLDNYLYFLKPLSFFSKDKNEVLLEKENISLLDSTTDEVEKLLNSLNSQEKIEYILKLNSLLGYCKPQISFIYLLNYSNEQVIDLFKEVKDLYNKNISKQAFINALYKVRRIEYINNIINFEPNLDYINDVADIYCCDTFEKRLLNLLEPESKCQIDKILNEFKANNINEDLLRLKFLKELKEIIGDTPKSDYIKKM